MKLEIKPLYLPTKDSSLKKTKRVILIHIIKKSKEKKVSFSKGSLNEEAEQKAIDVLNDLWGSNDDRGLSKEEEQFLKDSFT